MFRRGKSLLRLGTVAGGAALLLALVASAWSQGLARRYGRVELDVQSDYSHIRIRQKGHVRTLLFVRDSGAEAVESIVDLERPHELLLEYTRFMFTSYLFRPQPQKVLIVGLGGGSMVHFLGRYDPQVEVDVVEIDPAIVDVADEYFGVRSEGHVKIVTADGVRYLTDTTQQYDVIYLDAFLKPSQETDSTGVPLRLKTVEFYRQVQQALAPDGLVAFNLNPHSGTRDDVQAIKDAFPQTYVFRLPNSSGLVVVASRAAQREPPAALKRSAKELDRRFGATFSFQEMAGRLAR